MGVWANKLRYKGVHLNHTGVGLVKRVGYADPLKVKWPAKKPVDPHLDKLQKPFFLATSLGRDVPFREEKLHIGGPLHPAQNEEYNMFQKNWQNSIYVPNAGQVPFVPTKSSKLDKPDDTSTEPAKGENLMSAIGMGFYNFDPITRA